MIRVNLLPRPYQKARELERFCRIAIVAVGVLAFIMTCNFFSLKMQTKLYQEETANLRSLAQQYSQVNKRYNELVVAEQALQRRLDLALPLLEQSASLQPALALFTSELPQNVWLRSLSLNLDDQFYLEGNAVAYTDIAALIKWLEEDNGLVVRLDKTDYLDREVAFTISANTEGGVR